jgi:starch phosphorylase
MSGELTDNPAVQIEDVRSGSSVETLKRAIRDNLFYVVGRDMNHAVPIDYFMALAYTVRDRILARFMHTIHSYRKTAVRSVSYLSAEFLMGPQLMNNLLNLGLEAPFRQATKELGLDFEFLLEQEAEPGLGNGGLGRLAACYLDSMATLGIPSIGYGIRYEYGIFDQKIQDGWQVEFTDHWLRNGNPWELRRMQLATEVGFHGRTEQYSDDQGRFRVRWIPQIVVKGVPYDTPIAGYGSGIANILRLWRSAARESFYFERFNQGDYSGAVAEKVFAENITKVLYPNDENFQGKELRLEQQYFFTSCSLQDMIRRHLFRSQTLEKFHEFWAIQLNDTHPAIGVAELMRLLLDDHGMSWEQAWNITSNTFNFTNHTLLPEALERWPLPLFASLLPRHLEIIHEINARFLAEVRRRFPNDEARVARMSLIDESGERYVRMAHLACVGSQNINGVAEIHTQLLKTELLRDFDELWPGKIVNVTNGVTPRRWLAVSNPEQSELMSNRIGDSWIAHLEDLKRLETYANDAAFANDWKNAQRVVKVRLAAFIFKKTGITVDPDSMFDAQVKRIHEYKRQHLNVLHILTLYQRLKNHPNLEITPRTFIFGGKAAPGYHMAKLIIKLINSVAEVVNNDPDLRDRLKVVFLPGYDVTFGQLVYPAADLSEQISTAGKEASGTGNMKFAMNGALTIGTLDGANVEIRKAVGPENFFLFGLTVDQIHATWAAGYHPHDLYESIPTLHSVIDALYAGQFSRGDRNLFRSLLDSLLYQDSYLLFADYESYIRCQDTVAEAYRDQVSWARMSILNAARMGYFSSDRSIKEYCNKIWNIEAKSAPLVQNANDGAS